jgi:hypothetical protein
MTSDPLDPNDPNNWLPDEEPEAPPPTPGKLTIMHVHLPLTPEDVEERRPTAALAEIDYQGISLSSRWGKAQELEAMMAAVDWVADHDPETVGMVQALWCDSNFGQMYDITCREGAQSWVQSIGEIFSAAFVAIDHGHNGISVLAPDGGSALAEIYPDGEGDDEAAFEAENGPAPDA